MRTRSNRSVMLGGAAVIGLGFGTARGTVTGTTGSASPAPIDNRQPSLALSYLVDISGPTYDLGTVEPFAGALAPAGFALAQGQLLSIATNQALYGVLGNTYGGNGTTTFALPDLRGRVAVGSGGTLGAVSGANAVTLTEATMAAHTHTQPDGRQTAPDGGGQAYSNDQASLALNFRVAITGIYPPRNEGVYNPNGSGGNAFIGEVRTTAAAAPQSGYAQADGAILSLASNTALFSILGTNYGGDGRATFALPNLTASTPIGSEGGAQGPGLTPRYLGEVDGADSTTLTVGQLPAHTHTFPTGTPTATNVGSTGGNQSVNNMQSSLALNYVIALQGVFPAPGPGGSYTPDEPFLGEVNLFAGNFAPQGFAFADGSLLPISEYEALFTLIGTTYGGDGLNTFALPDLRGRTVIGTGTGTDGVPYNLGETIGAETYALSLAQLPAHSHVIVPEPATGTAIMGAAAAVVGRRRRRRSR